MANKQHEITLEDALRIATRNMNIGNYRVAELTLRDILASIPDHHESRFLLGMALYHMGNPGESVTHLKEATNSNEATAEWLSNYGVILNDMGRRTEAIDAFNNGLKLEPKNAVLLWNLSYALWLEGDYPKSEKVGRKAVKVAPKSPEAWLNLGAALAAQKKLEEAAQCWEKALKIKPDFAFAWSNMGNVLREMGRIRESQEKCLKALEIDPNYVEALSNLGNTYLDQGKYTEAEECYRKAVALKPDYVEAHNNLCIALMQQLRYDEAVMHGRYATSFNPNYTVGYINLSEALRNLGQVDEARKAIEKAVVLEPDSAEAHMDLADVLLMQDRYGDAEIELKKVGQLKPDNHRVYIKLSSVQERAGKLEEALKSVDKAVEMNPEMPDAYIRKGQIHLMNQDIEETRQSYKEALKLAPKHAGIYLAMADFYLTIGETKNAEKYALKAKSINNTLPGLFYTLAHLKKIKKGDEDFKQMLKMEKHIERRGLEQATALNFALFHVYEDSGSYKKAFEHLKKANDYKRRLIPFESDVQALHCDQIKKTYSKKFLKSLEGKGYNSKIPVFILGMPRSGTTLTEQILSRHPDIHGAGELPLVPRLEHKFGQLTAENCRAMGEDYVKNLKKAAKGNKAKHITDKMPANFIHLGLILSILPNAKIIHCRRNPIDNCLSCYKQNFARGQYWSYTLEELAEQYKLYEEIMDHWREVLPEGSFLEINYEDTVSDLEMQSRKIIDFIGLPWNKACLTPHKHKRAVLTASKAQVIRPVYKTSVKAWKKYGKDLEPLIKGLGMEDEPKGSKKKKSTKKTVKKAANITAAGKTKKATTKKTATKKVIKKTAAKKKTAKKSPQRRKK